MLQGTAAASKLRILNFPMRGVCENYMYFPRSKQRFLPAGCWLRVSCAFWIFLCEEFVKIICTFRDPSKGFCQFKHSLITLIRPSESFNLRWDSMKTSQITEEYGKVLIIAQRRSSFLASLELLSFNSTSLYLSQCRVWLFSELEIRFKKRKMYY